MDQLRYECQVGGCRHKGQPTEARWCPACGTRTRPERAAALRPKKETAAPWAGLVPPGAAAALRLQLWDATAWRLATIAAGVGVLTVVGLSLLLVFLLVALSSDGRAMADYLAGGVVNVALALATLGMRGTFTVTAIGASSSDVGLGTGELGHLGVVTPLLGPDLLALIAVGVATYHIASRTLIRAVAAACWLALRVGFVFALLLTVIAVLTGGSIEVPEIARMDWRIAPSAVMGWSFMVGTLAGAGGAAIWIARDSQGAAVLARCSPDQRAWLRALGGAVLATGTALVLASLVTTVAGAVTLWHTLKTSPDGGGLMLGFREWFVLVLLGPARVINVLGLALGGTLTTEWAQLGEVPAVGLLPRSQLPGVAYLLVLIPILAFSAGGLWTAARNASDPDVRSKSWPRFTVTTTACIGLLLILASRQISNSLPDEARPVPLLSFLPESISLAHGVRLADALLLAFGWSALGGYLGERGFPLLFARYGGRLHRVRIGRLALLSPDVLSPQVSDDVRPKRRPSASRVKGGIIVAVLAMAVAAAVVSIPALRSRIGGTQSLALAPAYMTRSVDNVAFLQLTNTNGELNGLALTATATETELVTTQYTITGRFQDRILNLMFTSENGAITTATGRLTDLGNLEIFPGAANADQATTRIWTPAGQDQYDQAVDDLRNSIPSATQPAASTDNFAEDSAAGEEDAAVYEHVSSSSGLIHPDLTAIMSTFEQWAEGINTSDYQNAFAQYTFDLQAKVTYQKFAEGNATSTIRNIVIRSVTPLDKERDRVRVTFTSYQAPEDGPTGETCTNWTLDYTVALTAGRWLIDQVSDDPGGHVPCT